MKNLLKYSLTILCITLFTISLQAQSQTKKTTTSKQHTSSTKKKTTKKPAPTAVKEVTITLKNACERSLGVYAGPKEGLRDTQLKQVGGRSTNTLYLKTNQVICVMDKGGKKPMACTDLKATTTYVEIASTGTNISSK